MSRRRISTIGRSRVAALVSVTVALFALSAAASAAAEGGISGKVTLAAGGAPVEGAQVCAFGSNLFPTCTLSAADGTYLIRGLGPFDYTVQFSTGKSGLSIRRQATAVTVVSGVTTPGIDAAMLEGGSIAGTVTGDDTGLPPVIEIGVCSYVEESGVSDGCTRTAADGTYEILGTDPGLHELRFRSLQYGYQNKVVHGVPVSIGATTAGVDAALVHYVPAGRISGTVYEAATHEPLQRITVCLLWQNWGEVESCVLTNAAGEYSFAASKTYKIVFSPMPNEVEWAPLAKADLWPTQWWNQKSTFAAADPIPAAPNTVLTGIDALLGPGPSAANLDGASAPPATPMADAIPIAPKPLSCGKGRVKKRVKGKLRCVARHELHHHRHKWHHHRHHHKRRHGRS